jgi:hypothetical protein
MLKFHHDLLATTVIAERLLQNEGDEEHCDSLADPPIFNVVARPQMIWSTTP